MSAVHGLRRIGRLAVLRGAARGALPDALEHVAKVHRAHHRGAGLEPLRRAYLLAEASHRGQLRKSGEPYITHPLAVTLLLAQLGAGTTTLTASLLHDTVEDTELTLAQVRAEFGAEVEHLVDGVTKLRKVDHGSAAESETFRKMLVASGSDVRVLSIKLADRLHNMRTLGVMRPEKQARIATVTRDVLIPLAERLGVQALKSELEDLVFQVLHPEEYAHARELVAAHAARPDPLTSLSATVRGMLAEAGIDAQVLIRPRHTVSVHRLLRKRGELGECDFARLLVLVAEDADCYAVLGELHTCFTPLISEFKDFIAAPKFNLYQSLHTAFADEHGRVVEALVRTHRMHRVAEAGVVALGDPDTASADESEGTDPTRPGWLQRLLEWQSHAPDPNTFWDELREELAQDNEITVYYVPQHPDDAAQLAGGLPLPAGATCVDAAYAAFGASAHRCVGARVNGRLAPLHTALRDGDAVQPILAPEAAEGQSGPGPSPEWLQHARTPGARIAIRQWLDAHESAVEPAESAATLPSAVDGPVPPAAVDGAWPAVPSEPEDAPEIADRPEARVRVARCCTPVPADAVTGFAVRGGGFTVHRESCQAAERMAAAGRSAFPVRWRRGPAGCRVTLHAESFGRPHLLADLTEAIAAAGARVVAADIEPPREQRVRHTYTLQLPDAARLPELMRAMRRVPGVYDVTRSARPVRS